MHLYAWSRGNHIACQQIFLFVLECQGLVLHRLRRLQLNKKGDALHFARVLDKDNLHLQSSCLHSVCRAELCINTKCVWV